MDKINFKSAILIFIFLIYPAITISQFSLQESEIKPDTTAITKKLNDFGIGTSKTPAEWLQKASLIINDLFIKSVQNIDTAKWSSDFENFRSEIGSLIVDVAKGSSQNISLKEIADYESRAMNLKNKLDIYTGDIKKASETLIERYTLASLVNDESFYRLINNDSSLIVTFGTEYEFLKGSADTLKAMHLRQIKNLTVRENSRNEIAITLALALEIIRQKEIAWHQNVLKQDQPPLWNLFAGKYASADTVTVSSYNFIRNSVKNYKDTALSSFLLIKFTLIFIIVVIIFYMRNFRLRKLPGYDKLELTYINTFPWLIMILALLTLFILALDYPPVIITQAILLVIMLIVSFIIFRKNAGIGFIPAYITLFVYYILLKVNDFILEPTLFERIFYILSIVPLVFIVKSFLDYPKKPFGNPLFVRALMVFLALHLLSGFFLNVFGYVLLSKVVISGGVRSFFMALFLSISVYAMMDYIYLLAFYYDNLNTSLKLDLGKVKSKIIRLLIFFAALIWIYSYLKETNLYGYVYEVLSDFLAMERTIGSTAFTIGSILLFPFILFLSFYVSGVIKQVVEVRDDIKAGTNRSGAGGILLMLRLFIVALGFLFALAVTGLPLDRLTILISALGVGIGFGLQNIINNLVSGIIIAVEKPFRVGDLVNFSGIDGTVKIIGIRSSVITSEEGSELIIPNGDLISKNLINWTSNNNFRRDKIVLNINSDIGENDFVNIINGAVESSDVSGFIIGLQSNIVSYVSGTQKWEIGFWITDIRRFSTIRSSLMKSVYGKLQENNIVTNSIN